MTDGRRLYFTDHGLSFSSRFDLSPGEKAFFDRHRPYDRCDALNHLVSWLVADLYDCGPDKREERATRIRAYARGERPTDIPGTAAALITRATPRWPR
ncbi:hypothetical protein [Streptomyces sp. NPDC012510]|uniref:hypothetical protein n=1 Tax=Streptomyces sp. NPDC012510 TaxID=3364838 RepID=UPI0036E1C4B1